MRRLAAIMVLMVLLFSTETYADSAVYFRKSDRKVVGTYQSSGQVNVQDSGRQFNYGNGVEVVVTESIPEGKIPVVKPDGSLDFINDPLIIEKEDKKQQSKQLIMQKLGLTDKELEDLKRTLFD